MGLQIPDEYVIRDGAEMQVCIVWSAIDAHLLTNLLNLTTQEQRDRAAAKLYERAA
jgi:hypothetical protein